MPKSQEYNIFTRLSLWSNKRKAINETVIIGFKYPFFIFSLILTFLKPCVFFFSQASFCSPILLFCISPRPCLLTYCLLSFSMASKLSCTLISSWNILSISSSWPYLSSPAALWRRYCSFSPISYKPKNPETMAYFFSSLLQHTDHYSSIITSTFAIYPCL